MKKTKKIMIAMITILFIFVAINTLAQEKEKTENFGRYVGKYIVEDSGFTKIRYIKLKNERLYYIAGDMEIPLKQISDTKFNLYPSQTFIDFNDSKDKMSVTITKGSGAIIFGRRVDTEAEE